MKDAAALNDAYEANNAVLRDHGAPYGLSGSVYTQIADVEGEQNGFCTYDRQVEKVDQVRVRASSLGAIAAGSKPTTPQAPRTRGSEESTVGHSTRCRGRLLAVGQGSRP